MTRDRLQTYKVVRDKMADLQHKVGSDIQIIPLGSDYRGNDDYATEYALEHPQKNAVLVTNKKLQRSFIVFGVNLTPSVAKKAVNYSEASYVLDDYGQEIESELG